jgi:hypothetical protein
MNWKCDLLWAEMNGVAVSLGSPQPWFRSCGNRTEHLTLLSFDKLFMKQSVCLWCDRQNGFKPSTIAILNHTRFYVKCLLTCVHSCYYNEVWSTAISGEISGRSNLLEYKWHTISYYHFFDNNLASVMFTVMLLNTNWWWWWWCSYCTYFLITYLLLHCN